MNDGKATVKPLDEISSLPRYEYETAVSGYATSTATMGGVKDDNI